MLLDMEHRNVELVQVSPWLVPWLCDMGLGIMEWNWGYIVAIAVAKLHAIRLELEDGGLGGIAQTAGGTGEKTQLEDWFEKGIRGTHFFLLRRRPSEKKKNRTGFGWMSKMRFSAVAKSSSMYWNGRMKTGQTTNQPGRAHTLTSIIHFSCFSPRS